MLHRRAGRLEMADTGMSGTVITIQAIIKQEAFQY
jgi:hypothetical protein